jgi:response regulator RpfG family c-di-GMP phosphodiesterase
VETVLILDDDLINLRAMSAVLRFKNYAVVEAPSGTKAIEIGKNDAPISILVADLTLPGASGTEVALELRKLCPDLAVLFVSGTPLARWTSRDLSNFKGFGPNTVDFLEKPFLASDLETRVRNLIDGKRTSSESLVTPEAKSTEFSFLEH